MFGFLNNTTIRAFDKKVLPLPYPKLEINIFAFIQISSRVNIMVMLLFPFFILLQERENMEVMPARTSKDHIMFL